MIRINKQQANEPRSWVNYRNTPGARYAASADLRNALLAEQGHICAFCMRRVPVPKRDPNEAEYSKIAHINSRTNHEDMQFDFDNMVICCPGNINGTSHCDKSQGFTDVTQPLFNIQLQNSISYGNYTGEIKSNNEAWNTEMNNILCLNNPTLKNNRSQTLEGVRNVLERKRWTRAELQNKLDEWTNFDAAGRLKPYCGIVIWYLEKKLRQMN